MSGTELGRLLTGRYRLSTVIGRGGMGLVWQARDELLRRDVAVKEMVWPPHFSEQEQQMACRRATREAQVAARLTHQNVVRIYDIVEEDGHPWIVMELLPYPSLRDIILEDGPLAPVQAALVGLGVLAALRAAHGEGVLHRDVKPANILIGTDGRVVLTDFGIARATDSPTLTTAGGLIGSPSYIAPERARGGQAGAPADLWGLGASLYAAVEGRPPFERGGALATLTAVVADEPEPPAHAGPLGPVISGLLRKDPDERLSAGEAERRLGEVAANGAVVPESLPARAAEPEPQTPPGHEPAAIPEAEHAVAPERGQAATRRDEPAAAPDQAPGWRQAGLVTSPPRPGRRRARSLAAALGVLAGLVVAAVVIAFAVTSSPPHLAAARGASSSPGAHPSARASDGTQPATSSSVPAPSGAVASGRAGTPAPSGSAGAGSTGGSGPGTGQGTAGSGSLPAGYYRFTNSTGFSVGVPQGWVISHVGHYVYVTDPTNSGIFLLIDQSDNPQSNPLADWEQQAAARASGYPGYHLIKLASVHYPQAEAAADWEFTYERNGVLVHILNRNVLANARHAYALYWSTPESDWTADFHYFQVFAASFRPAPA
jgi:eukaryotic-like serine/threonine-protein kinase